MLASLLVWGCIPELTNDCMDMTNASSTYLSIIIGAVVGGLISWLIYNWQQKTANTQELTLERIKELNERHDKILKKIEGIEEHNKKTLDSLMSLEKEFGGLVKGKMDK